MATLVDALLGSNTDALDAIRTRVARVEASNDRPGYITSALRACCQENLVGTDIAVREGRFEHPSSGWQLPVMDHAHHSRKRPMVLRQRPSHDDRFRSDVLGGTRTHDLLRATETLFQAELRSTGDR